MRAFALITAFAFMLCGCATPKITRLDELPPGSGIDRSPRRARYVVRGDRLNITPLDQNGVWLARVEVQLLGDDVYLYPVNISSPAAPATITLDFSGPKFPRDWNARLYWIQNVAAFPIFAKERTLYRKKIVPDETDTDRNGIDDQWEMRYFGAMGVDPKADPDGDGFTNLEEFRRGSDPLDYFNGVLPKMTSLVGPNGELGPGGTISLLITDERDTPLVNAPVTFRNERGVVKYSLTPTGTPMAEVEARTDSRGIATVYVHNVE